jgi:spermidine synthase
MAFVLLFSVFIIAACGLMYELIAGTIASYLLGDSVTQFSTVIGVYLSAMGVGAYLAKFIKKDLLVNFVRIELLIGLLGGTAASLLFFIFDYAYSFRVVLYFLVFVIGALVGLEIPLLMRILKERFNFADVVSNVLSFDYIGALVASVLFPLVLMPRFGLVSTCFLFGALNVLVAIWALLYFQKELARYRLLKNAALILFVLLVFGFVYGDRLLSIAEASMYPSNIIYSRSTPYQRVVITKNNNDVRLYLNGHLQFSSFDEYRYHEALVHVGAGQVKKLERALVLGGGDGMAVRELLKYASIKEIVLVDLDKDLTELFLKSEVLSVLNNASLRDARVKIYNEDAFTWIRNQQQQFDFIVMDFPDPTSYSIGKLYSTVFFEKLSKLLSNDGRLVVQSTSPLLARKSFYCVANTIKSIGFSVLPYHAFVPSFGEWGFVLAAKSQLEPSKNIISGLRYLENEALDSLFIFPKDMQYLPTDINRLNNQALARYYEEEWSRFSE